MKKFCIVLILLVTVISLSRDVFAANVVLAASPPVNEFEVEKKVTNNNSITAPIQVGDVGYIDPEIYQSLINELMHVGDHKRSTNVDGEIRYHYGFNRGAERWDKDNSGIRVYLGADTAIDKDWRVYSMLEGKINALHYTNSFKLARLNVAGKLGASMLRAGTFGYLMAEGNIYDSRFQGVRLEFGEPVKYTVSYGETDYTKKTSVVTARYADFDYDLEAGFYHFRIDDGGHNTIWTIGGNYQFSNFGLGAMALGSSLKDSKGNNTGYVLSLNYGDLKSYRPGTYDAFAKYYNQSKGTYIAHGMNGMGGWMQGFKGYGLGTHYTISKDLVAGIEYYNLNDKLSGESGRTWWSQLTYYF